MSSHLPFMQVKEKFWWVNWSKTVKNKSKCYYQPVKVEQIQAIVRTATIYGFVLKTVGSSHSPSDIALSEDLIINLDKFSKILEIDHEKATVKVQAGIRLYTLNQELQKHNLALSTLGSISDQSIAGAISTGTHGTGKEFGAIGSNIIELEIMNSRGEIVKCSKSENSDLFAAARCGLGAVGIVITVTLQVEKAFHLDIEEFPSPYSDVISNLQILRDSAEHVRIWWFPYTNWCWVWRANRTTKPIQPLSGQSFIARNLDHVLIRYYLLLVLFFISTFISGLVPWIIKLYRWVFFSSRQTRVELSYKAFNFDCLFEQDVNEWVVPIQNAKDALTEIKTIVETSKSYEIKRIPKSLQTINVCAETSSTQVSPNVEDRELKREWEQKIEAHFPIEIRFSKSDDDIWLSPTRGMKEGGCWIGIIVYRPFSRILVFKDYYFQQFELIMRKLNGKPHWAKAFYQDVIDKVRKERKESENESEQGELYATFKELYGEEWDRFMEIRKEVDPDNIFMNNWVKRLVDDNRKKDRPSPYQLSEATYTVFDNMDEGFIDDQ